MSYKYHAVIDFGYGRRPIKFTTQYLETLMKRFNEEVEKERIRRNEERDYTYIEPNLSVEVK